MTSYKEIYDAFFGYITDDMYMMISKEETAADCESLLLRSIPLFEFPKELITLDEVNKQVNRDLSLEEINIIAFGMVQLWLQRQITSVEIIRQKMTGADFKVSSQASHLSRLQNLLSDTKIEHRRMQMLYSRREIKGNKVQSTFYQIVKRTR